AVNFDDRHRAELIVDTGSRFTVISRAIATQIDFTPTELLWYQGMDGRIVQAQGGYVQKIQVGGATAYFVRVVVAEWERPIGYLGQNFLGEYDLRILPDEIEFEQR
ncbi:MAG: hypothetical protein HC857_04915, partial [Synechococcales cyanobacterium RU_4_20]|nr:hypothetical protein [Synechococcales cyanobacterium RU_4_20]